MGFFNEIGGWLNEVTGATSAGQLNQKNALQSGAINNLYQKDFAKNAHQWEVEDLQKAGLNPVLSAGGSGASASGGGVSAGTTSSAGVNPMNALIGGVEVWQGAENANLTSKTAENTAMKTLETQANTANIDQDTLLKRYQTLTEMEKGKLTQAQREKIEAEKNQIIQLTPEVVKKTQAETEYTKTLDRNTTSETEYESGINLPILGRLGSSVKNKRRK